MIDLKNLVGKKVNIICTDGRKYSRYLVSDFTNAADNADTFDVNEDSIDIYENEVTNGGVILLRSEIESIETV